MLALKKKKEAAIATAAEEAAATTLSNSSTTTTTETSSSSSSSSSSTTATASNDNEGSTTGGKKISLFGGDGARTTTGTGPQRKKMKPGEIRIQRDILELDGGTVGKVTFPNDKELTNMILKVSPDQGLWKGATFEFSIKIPDMYPHDPPKVHCNTLLYHPNVDLEGHVCLNILRDEWKPIFDINTVIYGIIYLFYEPNANDPLNHEAAQLLRDNKSNFEKNVYTSLRGGRVGNTSFPKLI